MKRRITFNSKENRDLFFRMCLDSLNFKTWNQLANFLKIRRSVLSKYRANKLTLPEDLYIKLSHKFNKDDKKFLLKNISFFEEGWGRIKAGKVTYSKYKHVFDEGRRKAIGVIRKRAHKFDMNLPLSEELAYFIGLFIGDGFTNKYGGYYLIQFTGSKGEKQFYETLFSDYCEKIFGIIPRIRDDKMSNAIRVNIYSIDLFNLITKRFRISAGRKSRNVLIPNEILNSEPTIIKSCIRGLYDAEGCVFFDKRKSYAKPYPRIDLHMSNLKLLKQVYDILIRFEIRCTLSAIKDTSRIIIYGEEQIKKFINKIGFSNPKHLEKLEFAGNKC